MAPRTLEWLRKNHGAVDRLLIVIFGIASMFYFSWRFLFTLDSVNPFTASILLAIEIYTLVSAGGYLFVLWNLDHNAKRTTAKPFAALIDVFIPTYNEPFEVIAPSIAAAKNIRLVRKVMVLDDGAREWVSELATSLEVDYLARTDKSHAKAGNLNHALSHNDAEFVLVLDCDHISKPEIVEKLIPYFNDKKVALVQTPQNFYNVKSFQHFYQRDRVIMEEDLFYFGLLAGRAPINATFWCGTGALIRIAALRDIGGIPTTSITEDILATLKMHKKGWKTEHHKEILARGLAAQNIEQYQGQRYRWGVGAMQVLKSESIMWDKNLTLRQKIAYLATLLGWFDSWKTLMALILPAIVLATGWEPISDGGLLALGAILGYFLLGQAVIHYISHGLSNFSSTMIFEITRLPATLAATMTIFSKKQQKFKVTQKISHSENTSTFRSHTLIDILIAVLVVGVCIGFLRYIVLNQQYFSNNTTFLIMLIWVLINLHLLTVVKIRIQSKRFGTTRRKAGRLSHLESPIFENYLRDFQNISVTGANIRMSDGHSVDEYPRELCIRLGAEEFKLTAHLKSIDAVSGFLGVEWDKKDAIVGAKLFAKAIVLAMDY